MLYGFCTSGGRFRHLFGVKRRRNLQVKEIAIHKFPIFQRDLWWARQGLNLRPHPCEGCALPLSYAPVREGASAPDRGGPLLWSAAFGKRPRALAERLFRVGAQSAISRRTSAAMPPDGARTVPAGAGGRAGHSRQ